MPTRNVQVTEVNEREARWEKDMPAYKRLRDDGLQPPHIDGSAHLEQTARDPLEVNTGKSFGKSLPLAKEVQAALDHGKAS